MPTNLNCQHFKHGGFCTHHAAPRQWFGLPPCVELHPPADVRLVGCALIHPHARPDGYPLPPPCTVQTLGGRRSFTVVASKVEEVEADSVRLREALRRVKYAAVCLADAQVIALEALGPDV